jgi:hypothetical protein
MAIRNAIIQCRFSSHVIHGNTNQYDQKWQH